MTFYFPVHGPQFACGLYSACLCTVFNMSILYSISCMLYSTCLCTLFNLPVYCMQFACVVFDLPAVERNRTSLYSFTLLCRRFSLSVCLSVCLSLSLSLRLSVSVSLSVCLCLSLSLSPCLCLSVCLSVCLSLPLSMDKSEVGVRSSPATDIKQMDFPILRK